jgi:hypothetical protein
MHETAWSAFWCMGTITSLCAVHCRIERRHWRLLGTGPSYKLGRRRQSLCSNGALARESSEKTWNGQWSSRAMMRLHAPWRSCWKSCPRGELRSTTPDSAIGDTPGMWRARTALQRVAGYAAGERRSFGMKPVCESFSDRCYCRSAQTILPSEDERRMRSCPRILVRATFHSVSRSCSSWREISMDPTAHEHT